MVLLIPRFQMLPAGIAVSSGAKVNLLCYGLFLLYVGRVRVEV